MPKPTTAKITDLEICFEAVPIPSADGEMIWADVRINYMLSGLTPSVAIRVPVPWSEGEAPEERKGKALQCARELIDHASRAAGAVDPEEVGEILDAVTSSPLEGIAQELGLVAPTARPRRQRGIGR